MKASVLLYNLKDRKKGRQITMIFGFLGFKVRHVLPEEYGMPIGLLAGADMEDDWEVCKGEPFDDEMLVINPVSQDQLNQALFLLRKEKAGVDLKAVVTPNNINWDSYKLHAEIAEEHRQMHGQE